MTRNDFVALYIAPEKGEKAATEATLMMAPRPRSIMPGRAALVSRTVASTWTRTMSR